MGEHVHDIIVVGAVPARELLARCPAGRGQEMAIVWSHLIGGQCDVMPDTPSKALLRPAQALAEISRCRAWPKRFETLFRRGGTSPTCARCTSTAR